MKIKFMYLEKWVRPQEEAKGRFEVVTTASWGMVPSQFCYPLGLTDEDKIGGGKREKQPPNPIKRNTSTHVYQIHDIYRDSIEITYRQKICARI